MAGKIKYFYKNWETLNASPFVLNIVKDGYRLPFLNLPPPFYARNNLSSLSHECFVERTIKELLEKNCVIEVASPPFCVNPLTVASRGDKLRLVLDLRHVNSYLAETKFKYENLKTVAEIFEKDFYFITFDLKSGYHHVPIFEEHWTYLGFSWTFSNGVTRFFVFIVLPFGLSSACYAFTKILRPLVKKWRSSGVRCAIYLDDGILGDPNLSKMKSIRDMALADLSGLGLTVNLEKSALNPSTTGRWLGFIIDTAKMTLSVPIEKITCLLALTKLALSLRFSSCLLYTSPSPRDS